MDIVYLGRYNQNEFLSGPEKVAKRVFNEMIKSGSNAIFIEYYFKHYHKSNLMKRLLGEEIIENSPYVVRLGLIKLFIFLIIKQPQIIHVITTERFVLSIFLYKVLLKGKIIFTVHGNIKNELKRLTEKRSHYSNIKDIILEKLLLAFSDSVVLLSQTQKNDIERFHRIDRNKIKIIPNGVDEVFNYVSKNFSRKLNIVFYNGWTSSIKGFDIFYDAVSDLLLNNKVDVFVIGSEPKNLSKNMKLNKIKFIPMLNTNELADCLKNKHIYINTSEFESFSLFAAECMSSGLIVLVNDNAGIAEYILNEVNGFTYNAGSFLNLKKTLDYLIEKKYAMDSISLEASSISQTLSWEMVSARYLTIYNNMHGI